jgi:protein SCO1/2
MKKQAVLRFVLAALLATVVARPAAAKDTELPPELVGIEIQDRRGTELPLATQLRDAEGRPVRVGDYLDGKHPLVVVLAYFDCPMLCSMVINGVLTEMKALRWTAGVDYRVLVVSFDPRDTVEAAAAKQKNYWDAYGRPTGDRGFDFDIGSKDQVDSLASALGFRYRWDDTTKQFAHAAGAFVVTPDGHLSRTLYGLSFPDLRLALLEASEGKIGSVVERVLLFCFHYDPDARGYKLATVRLVKASGVLTMLLLGAMLLRLWRSERKATVGKGSEPPAGAEQHA